ncbi:MAG: RNA polymerase factor sigma-54 [Agriterribacter sp.]
MIHQIAALKQQRKILPSQIELLNLMYLPNLELEQKINLELNENPFLEEAQAAEEEVPEHMNKDKVQDFQNWDEYGYDDIPDYKTEYSNYLNTEKIPEIPLKQEADFREELKKQLRFLSLSDRENAIGDFIIDSCNENGFLDMSVAALVDDISLKNKIWVEEEEVESILLRIHELEPYGIASRDIREFFLIQLRQDTQHEALAKAAICIFEEHFEDLQKRNWSKIKNAISKDGEELEELLKYIGTLRTRPVEQETSINNVIVPDFILADEDGELRVSLYKSYYSQLGLNPFWVEKAKNMQRDEVTDRATKLFMKNKLNSAQWFMEAIRQRETNMLKIMHSIVEYQREYFVSGDIMFIKPMVLKDIAEKTGLDISTVSRVTCNKFVATPFGNVLLKSMFSESLGTVSGKEISNKVVQTIIQEMIDAEDKNHPYTDQELASILYEKGYVIARRTVSKYREKLKIPVGYLRAGTTALLKA